MEKCFDRVDYSCIFGSLRYFNFGETYIKWISLFFTQFEVCTQNFEFLSEFFRKECSVNQGCIISPGLYLLTGEILANKIREHSQIRGIKIGDCEYLISQFADDMDLYLPYDKIVLNAVFRVLSDIENHTGLKVSYEKTTLYRIGSLAGSSAKMYTPRKVNWFNDYINTLGVDIYNSEQELMSNIDKIIQKMTAVSNLWYYRSLTIMGKVLIINTLMSSLFVYKLQVLPFILEPKLKQIYNTFEHFLWKGKRPKIPIHTLQKEKEYGGLGLVDLSKKQCSLLIGWIDIIKYNTQIQNLAKHLLSDHIQDDLIWKFNMNEKDAQHFGKTTFWKNLIVVWAKFNYQCPQNAKNIGEQILWYNSHIQCNNHVLEPQEPFPKDLRIKQLFKADGSVKEFTEVQKELGIPANLWLTYSSMITSVPEYWKTVMKTQAPVNDPYEDRLAIVRSTNKISSTVYHLMNQDDSVLSISATKWSNVLENFRLDIHLKAFSNLYKLTNVVKLKNFQYRLLHSKIFCNNVLFHWGLKTTQRCDFCEFTKQDILHLLWGCQVTKNLWNKLFKSLAIGNLKLTANNIIYNMVHPKSTHIVNLLVLITKFVIYQCKCDNTKPSYALVEKEINLYYNIEKYIANRKVKIAKFESKWNPVTNMVYQSEQ